jgi:hypothetical protein
MKMRLAATAALVLSGPAPALAQEVVTDTNPKPLTDKKHEWEDFLTDTSSGSVTAGGMLGLSGENVTTIENVRTLVFSLPSLGSSDSDQTIGLSLTPARTGILPMNLQSYANSFAMRLLGSLTLSYARGPATIEDVDFDRSAFAIDTNAFFKREDDVIVAYAAAFQTEECKLQAGAPPSDSEDDEEEEGEAEEATPLSPSDPEAIAIRKRAKDCRAKITAKVNGKWNRSQLSISYGEADIRIKDNSKPKESFGRTLAVSVIYGFGNLPDGTMGFAVSANYRRSENEPVLTTLASPQTQFKDSSLLVARIAGGNDRSRIFAEFSDARSQDITASQRAFKRALGIDVRAFEGTWLNFRIGKQQRIDGTSTETGSLLSITYSPKALL